MMTVKRVALMITILDRRCLCGVKQLQVSPQANAPMSTVPSAVKAGTTTILMKRYIVARTKQSIVTETGAIAIGWLGLVTFACKEKDGATGHSRLVTRMRTVLSRQLAEASHEATGEAILTTATYQTIRIKVYVITAVISMEERAIGRGPLV